MKKLNVKKDYVLVGSDFSQQEPRTLAKFSNCKEMLDAYAEGKDLYAVLACGIYKNKYEDNLEHYANGKVNVEGDRRRSNTKTILLGLLYGRGTASVAEQLGIGYMEAQNIIDEFFKSFPRIKEWTIESRNSAKETGYVEDYFGRRRRLPELLLPQYEITDSNNSTNNSNPLLGAKGLYRNENKKIAEYNKKLDNIKTKQEFEAVRNQASKDGIVIKNNGGIIAKAERQCVNARIQGSAASLTKIAMIAVNNNERLRELGFRMLLQVHDELIGECPRENAEEVSRLLSVVMKKSAEDAIHMPFKCDAVVTDSWYEDKYSVKVAKDYYDLLKKYSKETSDKKIREMYSDLSEEQIDKFLNQNTF